jgi:UDP-N-acetylmuramate dehydrogenase
MAEHAVMNGVRGEVRLNESMSGYTSWRVGGSADRLFKPADLDDLCAFMSMLPANEPVTWIGLGSNLLVRDGGVRGSVVAMQGQLTDIDMLENDRVRIQAGVSCAKAARQCARAGLVGLEFLAGIPGTVGGALAMNAGAFGGETWDHVIEVTSLDHEGELHQRLREEYSVAYRSVTGPEKEWFVAAIFQLKPGDTESSTRAIKSLLEKRNASQPIGEPSCGSVFRNPEGDYSGRLIESLGLKGYCIGGACVSEKHANFIINKCDATASEIERLIRYVQEKVRTECGVELHTEVRIIGEEG